MRIEKLHIYGYGKLENVEMDLSLLTVLYGENEAGKSTIRSFIKSILFGFKMRGQKRYEPKEGGKYGGAITVMTKQYGRLKIERLPKTASGEVTVYFEDGKTGGEEVLQAIKKGMNEQLFDSVFSFDMHGLQNIHQLGEAEIGNYLFSASAVGSDALLRLDRKLEKEMDQRFKPNGRKPEINASLQEMKKLKENLNEWQGKIGAYEKHVKQLKESEEKLVQIRHEKERAEQRKQDYEILSALQPLMIEKRTYEMVLKEQLGHFPVSGIARYESIKAKLEPLHIQLDTLQEKMDMAQSKMKSLQIDDALLRKESDIEALRMQHISYENARQEMREMTSRIQNIREEIEELQHQIGASFEEESVRSFDTSLAVKELITQTIQKARELEVRKQELDRNFQVTQEQLEEQEEHIAYIRKQMLSEEERQALMEKEKSFQGGIHISAERMQRKYEERTRGTFEKKKRWQKICFLLLLMNIGVLLTSVFLDNRTLLFTSVIFFVLIVLAFVLYKDPASDRLQEELLTLQQNSEGRQSEEVMSIRYKLEKDEEMRKVFEREAYKLQQIERSYEKIVSAYEDWERDTFRVGEQVEGYKKRYHFPTFYTHAHLLPAFERMEKMQQLYRELGKQLERKDVLYEMISQFEHKLEHVLAGTDFDALLKITHRIQQEKEKVQELKQWREKLAEWQEEHAALQHQMKQLQSERDGLWNMAGVQDEESFLEAGMQAEKREDAEKQLQRLLPQIDMLKQRLTYLSLEENYQVDGYEDKLREERQHIQTLLSQEKEQTERIAECRVEIANLEKGNTYGDLLHEWEMKKSHVREQVKKWAAYAAAKSVLTKTKQYYHEVHLPRILQKAEEYFVYLTGEKYNKIFSPSATEPFIVQRSDGLRFYSYELSQATAEQLYLSLRFALAHTFEHHYPFIIDDSFVHFDAVRTERTIALMKEIAKKRQVIFFTCHAHLLSFFTEKQMIKLTPERKENRV